MPSTPAPPHPHQQLGTAMNNSPSYAEHSSLPTQPRAALLQFQSWCAVTLSGVSLCIPLTAADGVKQRWPEGSTWKAFILLKTETFRDPSLPHPSPPLSSAAFPKGPRRSPEVLARPSSHQLQHLAGVSPPSVHPSGSAARTLSLLHSAPRGNSSSFEYYPPPPPCSFLSRAPLGPC